MYLGNGQHNIFLNNGESIVLSNSDLESILSYYLKERDYDMKHKGCDHIETAPQSYYMGSQTNRLMQMGDNLEAHTGLSLSPSDCSKLFIDELYDLGDDVSYNIRDYYEERYYMIPR